MKNLRLEEMILAHVEVVRNTKIVMEEINKTCKALKLRAFLL